MHHQRVDRFTLNITFSSKSRLQKKGIQSDKKKQEEIDKSPVKGGQRAVHERDNRQMRIEEGKAEVASRRESIAIRKKKGDRI